MPIYLIEGTITHGIRVTVDANSLKEAIEKANRGKYEDVYEEFKPNYLSFEWLEDSPCEVLNESTDEYEATDEETE